MEKRKTCSRFAALSVPVESTVKAENKSCRAISDSHHESQGQESFGLSQELELDCWNGFLVSHEGTDHSWHIVTNSSSCSYIQKVAMLPKTSRVTV